MPYPRGHSASLAALTDAYWNANQDQDGATFAYADDAFSHINLDGQLSHWGDNSNGHLEANGDPPAQNALAFAFQPNSVSSTAYAEAVEDPVSVFDTRYVGLFDLPTDHGFQTGLPNNNPFDEGNNLANLDLDQWDGFTGMDFANGTEFFPPIPAATEPHLDNSALPGSPSFAPLPAGTAAITHKPLGKERISCTEAGCFKTFARAGDFRRHMKKHKDPEIECPAVDCSMRFYRNDKMVDHARKIHGLFKKA